MKKINSLGFLSLLSLISILGWATDNTGLYGFFGFAYYIRYFWIVPDEMFRLNFRKSATFAFMAEMLALVLLMFFYTLVLRHDAAVPMAFGSSFAVAILAFTVALLVLEWKEQRGANE